MNIFRRGTASPPRDPFAGKYESDVRPFVLCSVCGETHEAEWHPAGIFDGRKIGFHIQRKCPRIERSEAV